MDSMDVVSHQRVDLERCPPGHNDRVRALYNLAEALDERFQIEGKIDDVDEANDLHRAALELPPSGHPDRSSSLNDLASCLANGYEKLGAVTAQEEAITLGRAAQELRSPGHSARHVSLNNLAYYLWQRSQKQVAMQDLDEAIELHRAASALRPPGHPDCSSSFHDLARSLVDRYEEQGVVADLEEAITFSHAVLELHPPGHPNRKHSLSSLAYYLGKTSPTQAAVQGSGRVNFLRRATSALRSTDYADTTSTLHALSLHHWCQFRKQTAVTDLDEAVCLANYALELRLLEDMSPVDQLNLFIKERLQRLAQGKTGLNRSTLIEQ